MLLRQNTQAQCKQHQTLLNDGFRTNSKGRISSPLHLHLCSGAAWLDRFRYKQPPTPVSHAHINHQLQAFIHISPASGPQATASKTSNDFELHQSRRQQSRCPDLIVLLPMPGGCVDQPCARLHGDVIPANDHGTGALKEGVPVLATCQLCSGEAAQGCQGQP